MEHISTSGHIFDSEDTIAYIKYLITEQKNKNIVYEEILNNIIEDDTIIGDKAKLEKIIYLFFIQLQN